MISDAQGYLLMGLVNRSADAHGVEFVRGVNGLVVAGLVEWPAHWAAWPVVLEAGIEALSAWEASS